MLHSQQLSGSEAKSAQVCIRIPDFMDVWLERRARTMGSKADVVRDLIEREMAREEEEHLRAMFDAAAAELTEEEREDRERLLGAFDGEDG